MTPKKAPRRIEEVSQAHVVRWSHLPKVRELMPDLRWLHHSPNGGKRDAFTGAQLKALGVKPGFPDLILPVRATDTYGGTTGLAIEMKTDTGRASPEQNAWLDHLQAQGWRIEVARSAQEARTYLCQYLGIDPDKAPPLEVGG